MSTNEVEYSSPPVTNNNLICCLPLPDSYGTSGPISVEANWPPFLDTWFEVANELGYAIADPNAYQIPCKLTSIQLK